MCLVLKVNKEKPRSLRGFGVCVLAEGDAKDRTDIIYLEPLPLFFK